jgi:hypothetical protein
LLSESLRCWTTLGIGPSAVRITSSIVMSHLSGVGRATARPLH